ncbi:MAG: hypothetical protein PHC93_05930 [Candidatus Omnitrophica bacterium]|nr:hypothetical protein [Candidatus Omnitrophota bacterium]
MERTKFLNLGWNDVIKGAIMAFLSALAIGCYQAIELGTLEFTWTFFKPIVLTSFGAALAYLIKNIFTNSEGKPFKKERKKKEPKTIKDPASA